jgi:hypothetical protein
MMKHIILTLIIFLNFLNLSMAAPNQPDNQLPKDWYQNPEDQIQPVFESTGLFDNIREKLLSGVLGRIFKANIEVIESIPEQQMQLSANPNRTPLRDEAPWHLEAFTTELAVYASGLLGALTLKGTPAVQVYWKKQGPKPPTPLSSNLGTEDEVIAYTLAEDVSDQNLIKELEPMIRSAVASGKIKDEADFRGQVHQAAKEFRYLVSGLNTTSDTQWWLSAFRFDLMVGASGKLLPAPVLTTGGDLRLRFDWNRMKRNETTRINVVKPSGPYILTNYLDKVRQDLQNFMIGMEKDLDYAFAAVPATDGLRAYNFRLALGITAKGNLGAVKGSASVFGHLLFSNPVKAPKTYPPAPKAKLLAMEEEVDQLAPLYIIEGNAPESHIQYANTNMIPYKIEDNKDGYFKVDRKAFRKGLMKAVKIGQWFAKKGEKAESRKWKLYQLKSSFELSISGNIELVSIGGSVGAEMSFYNMKF